MSTGNPQISTSYKNHRNPFPGLRAFGIKESHIYFGREGQSDEVLDILINKRFVTILGSSGTGKSSLMFSGVIPTLHGGYYTKGGSSWEIISARPGLSPLKNLALSFAAFCSPDPTSKERVFNEEYFQSIIRKSAKGIVHLYHIINRLKGKNLLIYLDQFEEIFRFSNKQDQTQAEESLAYVELIVETIRSTEIPVFIAVSMRSDFLGECEQFPELTNRINESHYLIPQMTRDQKRLVIEGPVAVGNGLIANRLIQQLLNDMGDRPDQLPVLQHALMRTWDYWLKNRKSNEPIDFMHYEAIGTVNEALSRHADEAFFELDENHRQDCERIFKIITEKRNEGDGIRRPTKLAEIAKITDKSIEELAFIIDKFRQGGRALLMPPSEISLHEESIIDISHEALMRVWHRLKDWVEEESSSSQMYLKLTEASKNYQRGIGSLWRPPDLQLAIDWRNKMQPTLSWAMQYDPNFEAAISFLNKSEDAYNAELENKERIQKERLQRSRLIATVLGLASVASLILLFFAYNQKNIADKQKELAQMQEQQAQENAQKAEFNRIMAEQEKLEANVSNRLALKQRIIAERNALDAELARLDAEGQRSRAERQSIEAKKAQLDALMQKDSADAQRMRAEYSERNANMLLMQSTAKNLALKSQQQDQGQLKALLALFAHKFNSENEGYEFDNDVYNALFKSHNMLNKGYFEAFRSEMGNVRSTALAGSRFLFSTGDDGKVFEWDLRTDNPKRRVIIESNKFFRKIKTTYSGSVVIGIDADNIVYHYDRSSAKVRKSIVPANYTHSIEIISEDEYIVSASDAIIYKYKNGTLQPFIKTEGRVFSIQFIIDQNIIITGTEKGKVQLWDNENGKLLSTLFNNPNFEIYSLALSDTENKIAIGDNLGNLRLLILDQQLKLINQYQLVGHDNRIITDLTFNDKLSQLISASTDGTIRIWNLNDPDNFPIIIDEPQSWIKSIAVDYDNGLIYAGCRDRVFRVYPLSTQQMSDELLPLVNRELTAEEWRRFVGGDIPYQTILDSK